MSFADLIQQSTVIIKSGFTSFFKYSIIYSFFIEYQTSLLGINTSNFSAPKYCNHFNITVAAEIQSTSKSQNTSILLCFFI
jgi:hypothetical protein